MPDDLRRPLAPSPVSTHDSRSRQPRRWWLRSGLVVALALLFAVIGRPARAIDDPALATRTTVLDNGLTVLMLEDHATPVVSFQIWVKVGSADESRWTGIAHLFEHMMFRGSKRLGKEAHERLIEARGGKINAFTSRDVTVYWEDVTSEHLPLVIELEAERLKNLDLTADSLASEREVVLEERRMRTEDDPQGRAFENLLALTFQAHAYRHPTIGWRSDIEKVDLATCQEFFETYYAPNNLVVVIAGDFDPDDALARIRTHFGDMKPAPSIPRDPTREPDPRGERRGVVHFEVRAPVFAAAWHAPPSGHADAEALDVASEILSSGRTSRLYRRLVYEEEKALSAYGAYWELQQAGVFYAFAGVRPDAAIEDVEALFLGEIARLRDTRVTEEELDKAKRGLEVGLIDGLARTHAVGSRIGRDWVTFGRIRPLQERLDAIRAVTVEDVQRVARTYLQPHRRSIVHVVPPPPAAEGSGS